MLLTRRENVVVSVVVAVTLYMLKINAERSDIKILSVCQKLGARCFYMMPLYGGYANIFYAHTALFSFALYLSLSLTLALSLGRLFELSVFISNILTRSKCTCDVVPCDGN